MVQPKSKKRKHALFHAVQQQRQTQNQHQNQNQRQHQLAPKNISKGAVHGRPSSGRPGSPGALSTTETSTHTAMNDAIDTATTGDSDSCSGSTDYKVVSESDLATTIQVLNSMAQHPPLFHSKQTKEVRRLIHLLLQQQNEPIDYIKRATMALMHRKWGDAMIALEAVKEYEPRPPKPGTIQRWVRDIADATTNSTTSTSTSTSMHLKLLSRILKLTQPQQTYSQEHVLHQDEDFILLKGWQVPATTPATANTATTDNTNTQIELQQNNETELDSLCTSCTIQTRIAFQQKGCDRTPPNHYDLLLHATTTGSSALFSFPSPNNNNHNCATITKHDIPFVPGAFLLHNVLTQSQCQLLQHITTSQLGYRPDHPIAKPQATGIDSCEWLVDSNMLQSLFSRVKSHLPSTIGERQLYNINARFRCFRYSPDCVYRPHIDGSWPESRLSLDGKYITTGSTGSTGGAGSSSNTNPGTSYYTFLIYLNDDFCGGETRFYMPTSLAGNDKVMARGIVPQQGAVLVFPQGNISSLVHEGSAVTKGMKYVIRTDVLYRAK